jgi:hypothetical protein
MLRTFLYCVGVVVLTLFFAACSSNDEAVEDASFVDASRDVNTFDVVQVDDAGCPPESPVSGSSCIGDLFCIYEPSARCHWDCWTNCPSYCSASRSTASAPCDDSRYRCENGTWKIVGGSVEDPCPSYTCLCQDAGLDDSTSNDAGSDDDAGS